ncbi:MAG: antibiotic biosynthesis monooxygenase [Propionibacteriaceae bacterium]|jgi:quinol monooxygenase YgiN|nr:antibiotic biosynthesis monooxygenase [Propionibacteriaceae bacterium]
MFRSLLYLDIKPGTGPALVEWYKEARVLEKAVEAVGCISTEMYPLPDNPNRYFVTALWRNHDDYQKWLDHPLRKEFAPGISQFLTETEEDLHSGALLESVHACPTSW